MSGTTMDTGSAVQHCFAHIRGPVILERLQSYGIVPESKKEAGDFVALADVMNRLRQQQQVKQASASRVEGDLAYLHSLLGEPAPQPQQAVGVNGSHPVIKQAADEMLSRDPSLYQAVFSLAAADVLAGG
jgi:hypothetical protein